MTLRHPRFALASPILAAVLVAAAVGLTRTRVEAQARGKAVYDAHCTECHGADGKGAGPSAAYSAPHHRDFSTGRYKIR